MGHYLGGTFCKDAPLVVIGRMEYTIANHNNSIDKVSQEYFVLGLMDVNRSLAGADKSIHFYQRHSMMMYLTVLHKPPELHSCHSKGIISGILLSKAAIEGVYLLEPAHMS